jgi:transcriptional regulator with XRE-family HTH domain
VNIKRIIGDNIRGYRHKLKWSQEELAPRVKLSSDYIGRVERGEENISALSLVRISKAFKIKPHLLMIENAYQLSEDTLNLLNKF